jgi:hypothetical protein
MHQHNLGKHAKPERMLGVIVVVVALAVVVAYPIVGTLI